MIQQLFYVRNNRKKLVFSPVVIYYLFIGSMPVIVTGARCVRFNIVLCGRFNEYFAFSSFKTIGLIPQSVYHTLIEVEFSKG